jgi:hypothetical protein
MANLSDPARSKSDLLYYFLAALAGLGIGWVDVTVNDLLLTALLVLCSTMLLGFLRRRRPWRWMIIVGACIPLVELAAYEVMTVKPYRAQVFGSFLAFLPGIAGSVGGALMRGVWENLKQGT